MRADASFAVPVKLWALLCVFAGVTIGGNVLLTCILTGGALLYLVLQRNFRLAASYGCFYLLLALLPALFIFTRIVQKRMLHNQLKNRKAVSRASGYVPATVRNLRTIRTLGGDAVGMSTVTEALTAAHCGLPLLGISVITNMAAGITGEAVSGEEVNETGAAVAERFSRYLEKILEEMDV